MALYPAFFPLFVLQMLCRRPMLAELEASRKAWDVATAAKFAAEKSTKSAVAKVKKAEKALADADRDRVQREQAITKRLNQILALAGGKYHVFSLFCLTC
jgi:hypothetical protein